ncbi:recombinase family protein [Psychrilyobacter atlanticus]|uniref:recombinase family protein n=1 Tax=Psychrilyobacter atlanticus TaxID=271091 RepID=UPI00041DEEF4|nr:recombinase family protein [Psychrilyobacter atlanticus]
MMKNKKGIIYVRESTKDQDWEAQLIECRNYAAKLGIEVVKEYVDQMSGARNDRKGFLELQDDIKNAEFDILILWELSRATRDFITYRLLFQSLKEADIELHSLQEGILATDDDIDKNFGIDIMALLNERERKIVGRRIKIRKDSLRYSGRWGGGRTPLGYSSNGPELFINDDAPLVREIFNLYSKGESIAAIARKFGMNDRKRVGRILKNPLYTGKIVIATESVNGKTKVYNPPKLIDGLHEPIISEELFYSINKIRKSNKPKSYKDHYLFNNVICQCGKKAYPCRNKHGHLTYDCLNHVHWHSGAMLEEQVIDILEKEMEKMTLEDDDPNNPKVRITLYENELKKIITKEKNLLTKYLDGKVTESLFDSTSLELSKTKKGIQEEIKSLKEYKPNTINIDNKTLLKKYLKKIKNEKDRKKIKKILNLIIYEIKYVNNFRAVVITNLI